jgi:hypothetical protein
VLARAAASYAWCTAQARAGRGWRVRDTSCCVWQERERCVFPFFGHALVLTAAPAPPPAGRALDCTAHLFWTIEYL